MNGFKKALMATLGLVLTLSMILVGCSQSQQASNSGSSTSGSANSRSSQSSSSKLKPVDLTWYYPVTAQQPDQKAVEDAVNKITKEKINATVHLMPIDFGDYETKMNTIVASGQTFDLVWTSNWLFNYQQNETKGAFRSIDDLLKQYGSGITSQIPSWMWDDVRIEGKLYAVPSYQIVAKRQGYYIQKRFIDKYNIDVSKIKTWEDIEPVLATLKKNEPNIVPLGLNGGIFDTQYYHYWSVGPGLVKEGDKTNTVLKGFPQEYQHYLQVIRDWYTKGYINSDAATIKNFDDVRKTGKYAVTFAWTGKPGGEAENKIRSGGYDEVFVPITKPEFSGVTPTMNAISRTSKHPRRAMMLLNLMNTDKDLYNLISFGIKDKDYTVVGPNTIKLTKNSGYAINENWVFGDVFNGYLQDGQPADTWDVTKKLNEEAKRSPYLGFVFDPNPVKTELANIDNVNQEYQKELETGSVDPAKGLPVYEQKLNDAGQQQVIAEVQKQLNDWLKKNKK